MKHVPKFGEFKGDGHFGNGPFRFIAHFNETDFWIDEGKRKIFRRLIERGELRLRHTVVGMGQADPFKNKTYEEDLKNQYRKAWALAKDPSISPNARPK